MNQVENYIKEVLATDFHLQPAEKDVLDKLPFYVKQHFQIDSTLLYDKKILLLEAKNTQSVTPGQLEKQVQVFKNGFQHIPVVVLHSLSSGDRKRLIQKGINFIVPGKQLFLPDLLVDLRDYPMRRNEQPASKNLLPSAQLILLYKILNRNEDMSRYSFKELAKKFRYTQMAITKAVENLQQHDLCTVTGTKERYLHFEKPLPVLWHDAEPVLVDPVLKRIFVDEIHADVALLQSNISALAEYTDLAPGRQQYYAIGKNLFYSIEKASNLKDLHEREGRFCIEVWKYDPETLTQSQSEENCVDPLSLYLSLRDNRNERIEMALDQILKENIW